MLKRVITSTAIITMTLLVVIFSNYIIYPATLSLLSVVAVYEILKVMKRQKKLSLAIPSYVIAAVFPILSYFVTADTGIGYILILAASVFAYLLYLAGVSIFSKGHISFICISEIFMAVCYVTVSFTSLSLLRYMDADVGIFGVALVFVVAWVCDVFAYLVGSAIGKHKLIPEISPKKTVEGAIGGIVFTALACLLYGFILEKFFALSVNYLFLAVIGVILSVVSQLGDLFASMIKREYGVKDYGNIFPGHGGVMDRFDSVISVSTVLLILCILFPPFTVT